MTPGENKIFQIVQQFKFLIKTRETNPSIISHLRLFEGNLSYCINYWPLNHVDWIAA